MILLESIRKTRKYTTLLQQYSLSREVNIVQRWVHLATTKK